MASGVPCGDGGRSTKPLRTVAQALKTPVLLMELIQRYSKLDKVSYIGHCSPETPRPVAVPCIHDAQKRLGPEAVAQLVGNYQVGVPSTELMRRCGIGKGTVLRILDTAGVPRRNQRMTKPDIATAIEMYQSGLSLAAVGRHFGREHTVIRDVLERAGIPPRDSHGRQR